MPDPAALMLARGGVALADSADAFRCYPDLWPSPAAARQAFHRAKRAAGPAGDGPGGECHAPLRSATYQRAGAGRRPTGLAYDPAAVQSAELPDRLWLSRLAERLHDARPKRQHGVRALDWAEWEAAGRAAAELPRAEWAVWRAMTGTVATAWPPRPAGHSPTDGAHR